MGKTNPATKCFACSTDTGNSKDNHNALPPTSSAKNCSHPKQTPILNLEARVGQAHVKSACESRATIHPSLLRGIFRGQRDRADTNQPTLRSASPSVAYAMRGVVPVRRDVVFVHHAWTIPDALALRAGRHHPLRIVFSHLCRLG